MTVESRTAKRSRLYSPMIAFTAAQRIRDEIEVGSMGWQDRPYYRDRGSGPVNPLMWLLSGSVPLDTWFGIRVRLHAFTLIVAAFFLITNGLGRWSDTLTAIGLLFLVVLLHEFGHCFGSRMVGGQPTDILMHPFGGLASAGAPRRPWANFITVIAGPAVNVLICALATVAMMAIAGTWRLLPWNPWHLNAESIHNLISTSTFAVKPSYHFAVLVFTVSYQILIFNLLPIFPLDGGQMLQSVLWAKIGYYKATYFAAITGMVGAVI